MTNEEEKLYRDLFKALTDSKINELLVQYAKIEYNKAVKSIRSKKDTYEYGYGNGSADAWQEIISLKHKITEIMKLIG